MSILDGLRAASFRAVPFSVLSTETAGLARRVQIHEYPLRDRPYVEDLGAQTGAFTLEAFVPWSGREALITACRLAGPGPLVHPLLGEFQVVCTACEVSESSTTAGISRFALTFMEAGDNLFPSDRPNSSSRVEGAADDARTILQGSFLQQFTRGSAAQWVTGLATGWTQTLGNAIRDAAKIVPGATNLADFNLSLFALTNTPELLLADPTQLASDLSGTIHQLAQLGTDPLGTLRMLESFSSFGDALASFAVTTPSRAAASNRREALVRMARRSAAVEASVAATQVPLESYDAAVALRDRMVALIDPEITAAGDSGDDDALDAMSTVLAEIVRDLRDRGGALARVRSLRLAATTPAVVLAYRLYGDIERDEELVARNRLRHPLFVPAGVSLEVLSA